MQVTSNFSEADDGICTDSSLLVPGQPDKVLQDNNFVEVGVGELGGKVDHGDDRLFSDQRLCVQETRLYLGKHLRDGCIKVETGMQKMVGGPKGDLSPQNPF